MSYNGSGVFSLVSGNPVVTGTTISSTWANNTLSDIATGLSTAITKDGQSTPTNNIPMGGFKLTGLGAGTATGNSLRWEQLFSQGTPATIASAATVDIGGANSVAVEISGTTTITSFGTNYNGPRFLRFTGALTLTHNATTLNLPGAANITTAAGDTAIAYPNSASNGWNVVQYQGGIIPGLTTFPYVPVRQTVLSGPVDSSGYSAFGGSTGSTTVTAAGTLIATAANGFGAVGTVDRVGSITNPSWTSLSTNGNMYMYLDIAANGTCTTGSTTLLPTYQWGGTYSTTNNQFTFNTQAMSGQVGNGATAAQTYRVFVGEVSVAGAVVTSITWYALQGRYLSALTALPAVGTPQTFTHSIGWPPEFIKQEHTLQCTSAAAGYSVGDKVQSLFTQGAGGTSGQDCRGNMTRLAGTLIGDVNASYITKAKSNGAATSISGASFSAYASFKRDI